MISRRSPVTSRQGYALIWESLAAEIGRGGLENGGLMKSVDRKWRWFLGVRFLPVFGMWLTLPAIRNSLSIFYWPFGHSILVVIVV